MTKKAKSFFAVFITVSILVSVFSVSAVALTPAFDVTDIYKSSIFYERLIELNLTGDQRRDIVNIAKSQLGYHEGSSKNDFDGMNWDGSSNYVEYNYANRSTYSNNNTYSYAWCASFVTWCARQAGVSSSSIINSVSCDKFVESFKSKSQYKTRASGYVPIAGDLIFFMSEGASRKYASHIGIVVGTDGTNVYTIEGNTARGMVNYRSYSLNNSYIVGYAVPAYKGVLGDYSDFELKSGYAEPGLYKINSETLNVRASYTTSSSILTTLKKGTTVKITDAVGDWGRVNYNGTDGWISLKYVTFDTPQYYYIEYNANGGDAGPENTKKTNAIKTQISLKVPNREGYDFIGWSENADSETIDYAPGDIYTKDEDVILYAVWQPITIIIQFVNPNGEIISEHQYRYGDAIEIPENPRMASDEKYEYEFVGWDRDIIERAKTDRTYIALYQAVEKTKEDSSVVNDTVHSDGDVSEKNEVLNGAEQTGCSSFSVSGVAMLIFLGALTACITFIKKKE